MTAWLVLLAAGWTAALEMVVLHTNDMHARLEPISAGGGFCRPPAPCYGGFPRLKAYVDRIKERVPNVLFLNAGDTFQGSPYYTIFKWRSMAPLIDALGINVMSLGNHEFDDGVQGLVPYLKKVTTPSVCCNIDTTPEPSFDGTNLHPWHLLNVGNATVAIIGYLTPDTTFLAKTGRVKFRDEVESLRRAAAEVRQEGADLVFAVGHSGWETDLRIGQLVEGVDLVVGGHTNTFLYTGNPPDREVPVSKYPHIVTQRSGKKVPVVQAFAYTKYVGYLRLVFDQHFRLLSAEGNPVLLKESFPEDSKMKQLLDVWKDQLEDRMKEKIGDLYVDLQGDCRASECNFGNFVTDAYVTYAAEQFKEKEKGWTDAPIAILNGGAIRTTVSWNSTQGRMTTGEGLTAFPFDEKLVKLTVNGSTFKEALEHAVDRYDIMGINLQGAFLQLSGVRVVYDVRRPVGSRVLSVEVRCGLCHVPVYEPLLSTSRVTFLTSQYVADGGDGYYLFKNNQISRQVVGDSIYKIFTDHLDKMSPVTAGLEGRILVVKNPVDLPHLYSSGSLLSHPFLLLIFTLYYFR